MAFLKRDKKSRGGEAREGRAHSRIYGQKRERAMKFDLDREFLGYRLIRNPKGNCTSVCSNVDEQTLEQSCRGDNRRMNISDYLDF